MSKRTRKRLKQEAAEELAIFVHAYVAERENPLVDNNLLSLHYDEMVRMLEQFRSIHV